MTTSSSQNTYHSVASDMIPIVDKHLEYMKIKEHFGSTYRGTTS